MINKEEFDRLCETAEKLSAEIKADNKGLAGMCLTGVICNVIAYVLCVYMYVECYIQLMCESPEPYDNPYMTLVVGCLMATSCGFCLCVSFRQYKKAKRLDYELSQE